MVNVWVVMYYNYDDTDLVGVYTTKEKAQAGAESWCKEDQSRKMRSIDIDECSLDDGV